MSAQSTRSAREALGFVAAHGVVLAAAKGPAPRLIDTIAGEAITGNWWSHPRAREIYNVLSAVQDSGEVLVCRLVDDRITLVHRRLWPALARLADRFAPRQIAQVVDEHSARGHHISREIPFPQWVPPEAAEAGHAMSEEEAMALIGRWLPQSSLAAKPSRARKAAARD